MATQSGLEQVRAAIAAFAGAESNSAQFESIVQRQLMQGSLEPASVRALLDEAIAAGTLDAGTLDAGMLSRLGFDSVVSTQTRLHAPPAVDRSA